MAYDVTTGLVRFSYVQLAEPKQANPDSKAKYSVALLLPKSDTKTKERLAQTLKECYLDAVENVWGGRKPQLNPVIKDGNGVKQNGEPYGPECKGHWVINVASVRQPWAIDRQNSAIDIAEIKSGDYGQAAINAYAYSHPQKSGVTFGLNGVRFIKTGEPLGGMGLAPAQAFPEPFADADLDFEEADSPDDADDWSAMLG